jgi:hypothetical protein
MESVSLAFDNMEPSYRMLAIAECLRRLAQRAANEAAKLSDRPPPKGDVTP